MSEAFTMNRGDHRVFSLTPTEDVSAATHLLFTAKRYIHQSDEEAQFQHDLGNGLIVENGVMVLTVVHQDTISLLDTATLLCDVQARWPDRDPVTVWEGTLEVSADVTVELDTSVPIYTTQPSATLTAVQAKEAAEEIANALIDMANRFYVATGGEIE
jgi:hypothetical protein